MHEQQPPSADDKQEVFLLCSLGEPTEQDKARGVFRDTCHGCGRAVKRSPSSPSHLLAECQDCVIANSRQTGREPELVVTPKTLDDTIARLGLPNTPFVRKALMDYATKKFRQLQGVSKDPWQE